QSTRGDGQSMNAKASDKKHKLLFVEDDLGLQRQLRWIFSEFDVMTAGDRVAALAAIEADSPPVVVLDLGLPPDADGASEGLATLDAVRSRWPEIKVIVLTGNEDRRNALHAVSLGAYDYCAKPVDVDSLKIIIERARYLQLVEADLRRASQSTASPPIP